MTPDVRPPRRKNISSVYGHRHRPPRKPRSDRINLDLDALHRHFWRLRDPDDRDRCRIHMRELGDALGIQREHVGRALHTMRDQGRIRLIKRTVYQISDPTTWERRRPSTHATAATTPQWG